MSILSKKSHFYVFFSFFCLLIISFLFQLINSKSFITYADNGIGVMGYQYDWTRSSGGINNQQVFDVDSDQYGNTYMTGQFIGIVDFNPSDGTDYKDSTVFQGVHYATDYSLFVTKFDIHGNYNWTFVYPNVYGKSLKISPNGTIIVGGGGVTGNAVILKLTRYGNLLDMDEFGQYCYSHFCGSEVNRIEYDVFGNILVSGYQEFEEFWDGYVYKVSFLRIYDGEFNLISEKFNTDSEYFRVNSGFGINEEQEIILPFRHNSFSRLVMFDYSVSPLIVVTSTGDMSTDIITNDISWNGGQLLTVGRYRNTVDFYNYGTGDSKSSSGGYDMYITIFNSFSGDFENSYTKTITYGGSGDDEILRIKVDEKGYVYVLGYFTGEVDLNPYEGVDEYSSLAVPTYFVSRFDNELNYLGVNHYLQILTTQIEDFSIDFDGNLYFVGNFTGSVNFNTDENPDVISSGGDIDIFITRLATTEHYFPVPAIEDMDPDLDISSNPQVNILSSTNLGVINDTSKIIVDSQFLIFMIFEMLNFHMMTQMTGHNVAFLLILQTIL